MRRSWNDALTQNLIGQKFSRLLVIDIAPSRLNRSRWKCLCDCENIICFADGKALRSGKKRSCGCLRREMALTRVGALSENNKLPEGESAFNLLYATYRCGAKNRKLDFQLTKDDFRRLTKGFCHYCGVEPKQEIDSKNGIYVYNGIDRRINEIGYTDPNCVSCCGICNWMKRTQSAENFIAACQKIADHQAIKNASGNRGESNTTFLKEI